MTAPDTGEGWLFGAVAQRVGRRNAWVDGVNSAVMTFLELQDDPDLTPVHCDLGDSVHPDSQRFIDDLERWFGKPIVRIKSSRYSNIDDVFDARKYLSGVNGAPCTGEMKFAPRLDYQLPSDMHLWGYTADRSDAKRFESLVSGFPHLHQRAPLIERGLTKADTHRFLAQAGIKRPVVYDLGMPNGNCLCCVKATSPNYWAHQRKHFPEVFARRAAQSRRYGARLTRIAGERRFIDEIPMDWPTSVKGTDFLGCGFHCETPASPTDAPYPGRGHSTSPLTSMEGE